MVKTWDERKEDIVIKLAWMLPRSIAYWAFVRVASSSTPPGMSMFDCTQTTCLEAMDNWKNDEAETDQP